MAKIDDGMQTVCQASQLDWQCGPRVDKDMQTVRVKTATHLEVAQCGFNQVVHDHKSALAVMSFKEFVALLLRVQVNSKQHSRVRRRRR